jgi:predicted ATPase
MLNQIFKYDVRDYGTDYLIREESYLIAEFYKKYRGKYFEIKDSRLEKLNLLFNKYFTNKEVIATPFGISISTKDFNNDINFDELSSGEKKLIILFTIIMFSDNLIILLDEPEMSLSVTWQKDLLTDVIINTNYIKLLVTTQSPYIVSNDELAEYLICLPMENTNE